MDSIKFEKKNVKIVAHRGLSGIERENTMASFIAAGNRSYWGIETDIHKTADGQFVVIHDENTFRVSGVTCDVEKTDMSVLRSIRLFDIYRGTGVPEGKKSMAFTLTFTPDAQAEKAFTPENLDGFVKKILGNLKFKLGIELR